MAETKPIPVRLSEDVTGRLDRAAARIGNNRAGVIRFLIDSWLAEFEKSGTASLPPNWKEIMNATDHRTRASRGFGALAENPNSASAVEPGTGNAMVSTSVVSYLKQSPAKSQPSGKVRRKAKAVRPPATPPISS